VERLAAAGRSCRVPRRLSEEAEARRAYRRELRNVARLLRWSGIALVLLGAVGIALGGGGEWFVAPSWISFTLGWALVLSAVVRRVRPDGVGGE
jgi:membrane protein YdbS with pleckstrin-like domain